MKYLAAAIVLATIVLAVMYRYELSGASRLDRWTGNVDMLCVAITPAQWLPIAECFEEMKKPRRR